MNNKLLAALALVCLLQACATKSNPKLPKIGNFIVENGDTIFHKIPPFSFVNQDSAVVTNESLSSQVYITDFFFTSCPSICPKVMKNMLTVYEEFKDNHQVILVNHTIDPKRDTQAHLKAYATNLGVNHDRWYFLTGDKDELLDIADDYFVAALEDPEAPGGFDHSGKIILVDREGHVRAFCEGTDEEEVKQFIPKVKQLLKEYEI